MDPEALRSECARQRRFDHLGPARGAIIAATIGTTMTGSFDNPVALREAASVAGTVHLHADAAGGGVTAAFAPSQPPWSFADGVDTMSITHKHFGSPIIYGIALARAELVTSPVPAGAYVRATDHTLGCSRSGLAPLILWRSLRRLGLEGLRDQVHQCLEVAAYATEKLERTGWHPRRFRDSTTVVFDEPARSVVERWHLPTQNGFTHLISTPHVTRQTIDAFLHELAAPTARLAAGAER